MKSKKPTKRPPTLVLHRQVNDILRDGDEDTKALLLSELTLLAELARLRKLQRKR